MPLLDRLERRFGWIAFPGLVRYVALFQILVFAILRTKPEFAGYLNLDGGKVLSGEVWRLLTFLFVPSSGSVFWFFFAAMFLFFMADALDELMGPFRVTLYVLFFLVTQWVAVLVWPEVLGRGMSGVGMFISNLFFALAVLSPRTELRIYFVVPVQIRWLAALDAALLLYLSLMSPEMAPGILWGLLPFLVMFVPGLVKQMRNRARVGVRRAEFKAKSVPESEAFHRCKVCGRTDGGHPELEFRVAADGQEYCGEHLPR